MTNFRTQTILLRAAVLVAVAGATARAQDLKLTRIRDDATREMVRQQLDAASARGLRTTEPLLAKALEGVAKNASTSNIRKAMNALEKRMRRANALLGTTSTADELAAGADALYVGVPEKTLKQMRAAAPGRSIAMELGVITELVARGVSPKQASKAVLDLMARGATGRQLTNLGSAVQADVAAGLKPGVALDLRGHDIMSLLPPPPSAAALQGRPR